VIEQVVVVAYLAACVVIGVLASRKVLSSRDEYWVAGRRIGPFVNSMAIMAALASGGSIIGVMGMAYGRGIPATLALFAGAVVGFPIASILVARPLRNFGRFTITDFLTFRYPHPVMRLGVPSVIVVSFTVYIVAQMKAAGITAEALLGIEYELALTLSTLVFVLYVSVGGMLAITWTDVVQGALMVVMVVGTAGLLLVELGSPLTLMEQGPAATLGVVTDHPLTTDLGAFAIWAAAIPVIPHIVMRVYTARDARGARLSLNLAMVFYSVVILAAVLVIVPVGKAGFPDLADPDQVFLRVIDREFSPVLRGLAVAAVLAAVMSTTDALLLACSSAVAHDLISGLMQKKLDPRTEGRINVAVVWVVGLVAMGFAYSPPALITELYSAAIGVLSAGLFVPVVAGLWWKRANRAGGVAAFATGTIVYLVVQFTPGTPLLSAILAALPAAVVAIWLGARLGRPDPAGLIAQVASLHRDDARSE
jgi:sodium/pantothenate symporter